MFPERLKKLRQAANLNQTELAEKIHTSPRTVSFLEKGVRSPSIDTLIAVAKLFDVSIDYLVGVSDIPHPNTPNSYDKKIYALSKEDRVQLDLFLDFLIYKAKVK